MQRTATTHAIKVQSNGAVVLRTRGPNFVRTGFAPDLRFALEYKAAGGSWVRIHGEYDDERKARRALAESNPRIIWRLVAFNEFGAVALPKGWQGYER